MLSSHTSEKALTSLGEKSVCFRMPIPTLRIFKMFKLYTTHFRTLFQTLSKWIPCGYLSYNRDGFDLESTHLCQQQQHMLPISLILPGSLSIFHPSRYSHRTLVRSSRWFTNPKKYKISHLALCAFLSRLTNNDCSYVLHGDLIIFPTPYKPIGSGMMGIVFGCWMMSKMSKSMADTRKLLWVMHFEISEHYLILVGNIFMSLILLYMVIHG